MTEVATIRLSLPAKALHPNARPHHMAKARATKAYRYEAVIEALRWIRHRKDGKPPNWVRATCCATFYFKDKRRRDRDGMLSSLKAVFDGLADAGLIMDDEGLTHLPVIVDYDKARPRVELRVVGR